MLLGFMKCLDSVLQRLLRPLKENRVKKYTFKPSGRVVWVVVGKERDYLIMPDAEFCSCDDFYFRVI
jgi:predicted nucleic acid-binding Zn finger protein